MPVPEIAVLDEQVRRVHGDVVVAGVEVAVMDVEGRAMHVDRIRVVRRPAGTGDRHLGLARWREHRDMVDLRVVGVHLEHVVRRILPCYILQQYVLRVLH
eukprot:scaffold33009_cov57-Phaeocystis_antarctica.AAC.3